MGNQNTASGGEALHSNTIGSQNTACGAFALTSNTTGWLNTASGTQALYANTTGSQNTASGSEALKHNTKGSYNTASGAGALYNNTTGSQNTATGKEALTLNTTGSYNTACGAIALAYNTTGFQNAASGQQALFFNTTGYSNTANGFVSLFDNTTGNDNTAVGVASLTGNTTGTYNTVLGSNADVTATNLTNATALGYNAKVDASNKVQVGNTGVTVIGGQVGWSKFSDGRFKSNIKENVPGLQFINKLKPVTYTVQLKKFDQFLGIRDSIINKTAKEYVKGEKIVHTGFIAQDVERIVQEIGYDFDGVNHPQNDKDNYSLVYADFVPSLVKGMQELSKMNDDKDSAINAMKDDYDAKINALQNQINELKSMMVSNRSAVNGQLSTAISSASLQQNIPNPFNHATTINYTLPQTHSSARIVVTDKSGSVLKEITISGNGKGSLKLDASTLAAGAYNYSLYVNGKLVDTKQMLLQK